MKKETIERTVVAVCIVLIVATVLRGVYLVNHYTGGNDNVGVAMVRELYEYDTITDVYAREATLKSKCTREVWEQISWDNEAHWDGTWNRTKNAPTKVRVVLSRPGLVVYALENDWVPRSSLWCFEYEVEHGLFTQIREYKLISIKESKDGGFF